ncbi:uncharacterized protein [Ptychodera flava]|uniref:uncharacterized protein n=1 Tax=Ptychodera flava TaxID=63121 RepID=UPI00396A1266
MSGRSRSRVTSRFTADQVADNVVQSTPIRPRATCGTAATRSVTSDASSAPIRAVPTHINFYSSSQSSDEGRSLTEMSSFFNRNTPISGIAPPDIDARDFQEMMAGLNSLHDIAEDERRDGCDFRSELREQFTLMLAKISRLEEKQNVCRTESGHKENQKTTTPPELSMKIKNIQANGGDEMQFKVPDGWNTAHNLSSREKIYAELSMKFGDKFSEKEYKMAIRRSYENSRLKHREASDLALKRKNKNRRIGNTQDGRL